MIGQASTASPIDEPHGHGEIILLVEDQPEVAEVAANMLDELGYVVISASDANEALAIIDSRDDIDLLITDVVMPGSLNGADLALQARSKAGLKAILVTGFADNAIPKGQFDRFDVLLKPFRMDELARRVRAAIDG
ncbi:MAG: response regulator [Sphingomonadaceae bacterium]|nr:response regulator [Sphingomonadaceae bacterium]